MRMDRHEWLMQMAHLTARRATCTRAQVGAVLTLNGHILSVGYNGAPSGVEHCWHDVCENSPCTVSVHAEANAIAFAAKHGTPTDGATMYVTLAPCVPCAQLTIAAGIVRVVYDENYRSSAGLDLLRSARVEVQYR